MIPRLFAALIACAIYLSWTPVRADDKATVVVPFSLPGTTVNGQDVAATAALIKALEGKGVHTVSVDPIDRVTLVSAAGGICEKNNAQRILVPFLTTGQEIRSITVMFVPVVHWPTHAEVRLAALACDGSLSWTTVQTASKDYIGTNAGSAVTAVAETAVGQSVTALLANVTPSPGPTPKFTTGKPPKEPTIAVVPFVEPGAFDPLLNDATQLLINALTKRHLVAIATGMFDHLTVLAHAADICAQYNVKEIEVGTIQTSQSIHFGGNVDSQVDALVDSIDCSGKLVWSGATVGKSRNDPDYGSSKEGAARDALDLWATARVAITPAPTPMSTTTQ